MELLVFGLNHRTAPLEVRECWSLSAEAARRALGDLKGRIDISEHLILSTCNRTEFYSHIPATLLPSMAAPAARGGRQVPGALDFCWKLYGEASRLIDRPI